MALFEFAPELLIRNKMDLPDEFAERKFVEGCATVLGVAAEDPEYLEAIRQWRETWRPKPVWFLMVAESDV